MKLQSNDYLDPIFKSKKLELETLQNEITDALKLDDDDLKKKSQLVNR